MPHTVAWLSLRDDVGFSLLACPASEKYRHLEVSLFLRQGCQTLPGLLIVSCELLLAGWPFQQAPAGTTGAIRFASGVQVRVCVNIRYFFAIQLIFAAQWHAPNKVCHPESELVRTHETLLNNCRGISVSCVCRNYVETTGTGSRHIRRVSFSEASTSKLRCAIEDDAELIFTAASSGWQRTGTPRLASFGGANKLGIFHASPPFSLEGEGKEGTME